MKDNRTLGDLAREAIQIQDACNLSGLVHSWSKAITRLWEVAKTGTDGINTHPITKMWVFKLAELSGVYVAVPDQGFSEAYAACRALETEDLVSSAAEATEVFSQDELEAHALNWNKVQSDLKEQHKELGGES